MASTLMLAHRGWRLLLIPLLGCCLDFCQGRACCCWERGAGVLHRSLPLQGQQIKNSKALSTARVQQHRPDFPIVKMCWLTECMLVTACAEGMTDAAGQTRIGCAGMHACCTNMTLFKTLHPSCHANL